MTDTSIQDLTLSSMEAALETIIRSQKTKTVPIDKLKKPKTAAVHWFHPQTKARKVIKNARRFQTEESIQKVFDLLPKLKAVVVPIC